MLSASVLTVRQRELVAIGASIGGNYLACLRHQFAEAMKSGCTLEEIGEAIELSKMVKELPMKDIYKLADEFQQREREGTDLSSHQMERNGYASV